MAVRTHSCTDLENAPTSKRAGPVAQRQDVLAVLPSDLVMVETLRAKDCGSAPVAGKGVPLSLLERAIWTDGVALQNNCL